MKHKLNLDEQIEHMKNKGVKFNLINEQQAKDNYLLEHIILSLNLMQKFITKITQALI